MDNIKVSVKNMTKKFGDLLVLDDVSFDVRKGEFLCVVGPTGCGKTTFLNCITKLYEPTSGEILIDGEPVNLRKHNVSYIFQEYSTMPWLNVEENIAFGLNIKHRPESEVKQKSRRRSYRNGRPPEFQKALPKPALCQHASARCHSQGVRYQARAAADG